MRKSIALLIFAIAAPAVGQQINSKDILSSFALRELFRDRRVTTHRLFRALEAPQPTISYTLNTGVGYSDALY